MKIVRVLTIQFGDAQNLSTFRSWLRSWLGTEGCNIFIFHSLYNLVDLLRDSPVPKSNISRSHPMVVSFGEDDHGNRTQLRAGDFRKFALNCWVFGTSRNPQFSRLSGTCEADSCVGLNWQQVMWAATQIALASWTVEIISLGSDDWCKLD